METKKGKLREIVNWLIPTLLGHGRPWSYYLRQIGCSKEKWNRVVMNQETKKLIRQIEPEKRTALEISGNQWAKSGFYRYKSVYYPEFDICQTVSQEKYDFIAAEQVFEHLLWPYRAARNVHAMLNPGGYFLITTPFLIKIHEEPVDCTRWSETGLRYFLAEAGFDMNQMISGSWGNRKAVKANLHYGWQLYRQGWHSLKNEPKYPLSVWILAKKE